MPPMIFFCEQCGEKYKFTVDLSMNKVFDKDNGAPNCPTENCGRELSPILSLKIDGIYSAEEDQVQHFYRLNRE